MWEFLKSEGILVKKIVLRQLKPTRTGLLTVDFGVENITALPFPPLQRQGGVCYFSFGRV